MTPIDVFKKEITRESYIREMTDDFSSVDKVEAMGKTDDNNATDHGIPIAPTKGDTSVPNSPTKGDNGNG